MRRKNNNNYNLNKYILVIHLYKNIFKLLHNTTHLVCHTLPKVLTGWFQCFANTSHRIASRSINGIISCPH